MRNEITREAIVNILTERNFNALPNDVTKNGVVLNGIVIKNDTNCAPVMYIENYVNEYDTVEEIADAIIRDYEAYKNPDIDISHYFDREWVLSHLYIGLQKASSEELIKRDCELESIEEFIYVRDYIEGGFTAAKLSEEMMNNIGVSLEEAWKYAEENTFSPDEFVIKSMSQVIGEIMGRGIPEESTPDMYVVTNKNMSRGSVQVLNKLALRSYFPDNIHKLYVIPSSIHECIILTLGDCDISDLNDMINEVNQCHVKECEQLGNCAYIMDI